MFRNRKINKEAIKNSINQIENDQDEDIQGLDVHNQRDDLVKDENEQLDTSKYLKDLKYIQKTTRRRFLGLESTSIDQSSVDGHEDNDEEEVVDVLNKNFDKFSEDV